MQDNYDFEELPFSAEAEQSVLGALLLDPSVISKALLYLDSDSFYQEVNGRLFSILVGFFTSGERIDFITVLDAAILDGIFSSKEEAKEYLKDLMDMVPSISNLESYCKIVKEKKDLRSLILAARKIIDMAVMSESDAHDILDLAEQEIVEIRDGKKNNKLIAIDEVIEKEFEHLDKIAKGQVAVSLSSGYLELDAILNGLNPSDLIILAARPAMGKTSFVLNIATRVAKQSKKKVVIFSLEMSMQQLVERMLSFECSILSNKIHKGDIKGDEWALLIEGAQNLSSCNILFDDSPNLTVPEMKAKLRRVKDLGLVVIDYLQLMSTGKREGNRVQEISEITRTLKVMAKELDVPVITISQLARGPDARQDHRPILSDLRESGSIEQDADIVMFLYRDEYYNPEEAKPGIAECIIAKNRHGETGTFELGWDGKFTRFIGLDKYHNEN